MDHLKKVTSAWCREWPVHKPEKWPPREVPPYLIAQEKLDGAWIRTNGIIATTRAGHEVQHRIPIIVEECARLYGRGAILEGELMHPDGVHAACSAANYRNTGDEGEQCWLAVFDLLAKFGADRRRDPYSMRRALLGDRGRLIVPVLDLAIPRDGIEALARTVCAAGGEGVIVRNTTTPHGEGVWKVKPRRTADLIAVGWDWGKGRLEFTLGKLHLEDADGVDRGAVGTGFTDEQREEVRHMMESEGSLIVEVAYQEVDSRGRLRHPSFSRVRTDKPRKECVL